MKTLKLLVLMSLLLAMSGCARGGNRMLAGRHLPPPKEPPPVPARKDEPVDRGLVAAARQELASALASDDPVLRENAMEAVRQVRDPVAAELILKGLDDPLQVVRFRAALAAGEHRLDEARPKLQAMVEDSDPHLRIAAIFALHRQGVTDFTHDLEKTAVDTDPGVRGDTAYVIGLLGEKSGLKVLKVLARDPVPVVRQRAWEGMWRLGDDAMEDELVGLTISKYVDDQINGLLALGAPRPVAAPRTAVDAVRWGLTSDHTEASLVAARALGALGSDEGYGVALKGARSGEGRHRFLAALAFGGIGRTDAQGTLRDLMKDKDRRVKVAAATAVLEIAGHGSLALVNDRQEMTNDQAPMTNQ